MPWEPGEPAAGGRKLTGCREAALGLVLADTDIKAYFGQWLGLLYPQYSSYPKLQLAITLAAVTLRRVAHSLPCATMHHTRFAFSRDSD